MNAGVYLLEPSVQQLIPRGKRLDMPDLIDRLLTEGRTVASFPIVEYWLDIGRHDDFQQAQRDARSGVRPPQVRERPCPEAWRWRARMICTAIRSIPTPKRS